MRRHLLVLGAAFIGTAVVLAQSPPVASPPGSFNLPREPTPVRQLPDEVLRQIYPRPGVKPSDPPPLLGLAPGPVPPPAQPLASPKTEVAPAPAVPQRFDNSSLRVKREGGSWQLWAGSLLLKDFGPSEADAREAVQVFRDLRVNSRGSVGGVFEFWLADGEAPSAFTRFRQVVPFDPRSLRVERFNGQWVLRDARIILYNFGPSETDARQALAVCQRYSFNQLGCVGHPTPSLKYLMRDPNPQLPPVRPTNEVVPASAKMQASEAPRVPLVLPNAGAVGERVPLDSRRLDLRRETGEWVLYAGRVPLGRFGANEREARSTLEVLQQFRVTELCRVGESGFCFFLSNGRAPRGGSIVGLPARPLRPERLSVRQVGGNWVLSEDSRTLWSFGARAEDAQHALAAVRHYGFDYAVPLGGGRLGDIYLLVKDR
jgi:hypothetical protein